ncbi:hypothetical protein LSCM1_02235 [Leishmania martiniquensis]|uniref:Uncharacterized protein n=1 Tax=Leishmania martiniquensis TaxID=1580590 RepID=A0A836GIE9_9TRYP|nr:hypothetical protein LSCM1_02235 [Leishmania martiniquensis]
MATESPSGGVDLLRFLALSLAVHADAVCCSVDDVEAAIVESSTNDELLDALENELVVLLDRQRRLHVTRSIIALSQEERRRGVQLRQSWQPSTPSHGGKRIQISVAPSSKSVSLSGGKGSPRERSLTGASTDYMELERGATAVSARGLSTTASSPAPRAESEVDAVDAQVERLKARIAYLDRYSLRGKLVQLEAQKRAVKEIDMRDVVTKVVDSFEFPASVRALWCIPASPPSGGSRAGSCAPQAKASRSRTRFGDATLPQLATGLGAVVNHTNIDLLLSRACQRLTGRASDALRALASTSVSEKSAAPHVLGCMVYAAELDSSGSTDLASVQQLQMMPQDTLSRLFEACVRNGICEAKVDDRCFGARGTVLTAQDFNALPANWAAAQSLSRVPMAEVLPPVRHLFTPRFTFADVAELRRLQARRVELQEKVVTSLVGRLAKEREALHGVPGSQRDCAAAAARLALVDATPECGLTHAWKTMVVVHQHED